MRLGLSLGHGKKWHDGEAIDDPGAVHLTLDTSEFRTCTKIWNILRALLTEHEGIQPIYAPIEVPLNQRIQYLNQQHDHEPIDLALELHLNGFHEDSVDGTETLYYPGNETGLLWAAKIQESLVGALGLKNRGTKPFGDDDWEKERNGFVRRTKMTAIIVEPFFITNTASAEAVLTGDRVHQVAWAIFRALID